MQHVQVVGFGTSTSQTLALPAGTARIGDVGIVAGTAAMGTVTLGAGTAEVGKLAAGAANIGTIYATDEGGILRYAGVATTAQFASIALTSSAANAVIITSVSAKKIVLLSAMFAGSPAMTVQFFSAATTLSGSIPVLASTPFVLPDNKNGWLVTNAGESLTVTPSVSGQFKGMATFIVI